MHPHDNNPLIRQSYDHSEVGLRGPRLQRHTSLPRLRYQSANGMMIEIDCSAVIEGGEAVVRCPSVDHLPVSHSTHTYGDGKLCLADSIAGWSLSRILFFADAWCRGYEIWQATGHFPDSPAETFSR